MTTLPRNPRNLPVLAPAERAAAIEQIRAAFARMGTPGSCVRCGGRGYREDIKHWHIVAKEGGRVCFRCKGTTEEPKRKWRDPEVVRAKLIRHYHVQLASGVYAVVSYHARRDLLERREMDPFFPLLADVHQRAAVAAEYADPSAFSCLPTSLAIPLFGAPS